MGKLAFAKKDEGGIAVVAIGGEIDTGVAPQLETELRAVLAAGTARLVGDLSALEHVTSAGIGVLIAVKNEAKAKGGDFVLCGVSEKILKVFALLNLTKLIKVLPTVAEAKKAF